MIVNLRGANGSGKSTVAHDILKNYEHRIVKLARYETPKGAERWVEGYRIKELDLVIVGRYATQCGGCDGIKTQDLVCEAVMKAQVLAKHVLFEGVIVSTLFGRYADLAERMGRSKFVFAYLDTPLATCFKRIQKRNGGKAIKEDLVAAKVRAIASTREKAKTEGFLVADIPHKDATAAILNLLRLRRYR